MSNLHALGTARLTAVPASALYGVPLPSAIVGY